MKNKVGEEAKRSKNLTDVLKEHPELGSPIKDGDVFDVHFIGKDQKRAYFDIPGRGTGIVFGQEISNARDIIKTIKEGDKCTATIINPENDEGYAELSLVQALQQQGWQEMKRIKEESESVIVKIQSANSGGLITDLNGVKAFIPVSQLSPKNYPHVEDGDKNKILDELKKFIGKDMEVRVLDFSPKNGKLILSEKGASEEVIKKTLEGYKEGDLVDVTVSGIADFGVFVHLIDDPNVEGLVHISEIDHKLIESPKEAVKIGDVFKSKIIEIKNNRMSLSFKALKPNPWDDAEKHYKENDEVKGEVNKYNSFGALVTLDHELQGFVHISEFENLEKMKEALVVGKSYDFVITSVKSAEKRIILKLKV